MIPDALDMFHWRDMRLAMEESVLPECDHCNQAIQDEHYYDIDGYILCPACLDTFFKKNTEDYEG